MIASEPSYKSVPLLQAILSWSVKLPQWNCADLSRLFQKENSEPQDYYVLYRLTERNRKPLGTGWDLDA